MPLDADDLIALQRATHAVILALDAELAELGLSASELNLIACLSPEGPRRIGEVIADTAQRPSTVTGILDRLERRGLVERSLDPGDRRSFRAALTPEGVAVRRKVLAGYERVAARTKGSADFRSVLRALGRTEP
ncbi:MAG TPA: MarR family transcriptional regulator [Gaiellales bacterium]